MTNRLSPFTHSRIEVYFTKNSDDFVVKEVPLYEASGEGEHLMVYFRKKDLTTWQALSKISEITGAKVREIGYAGLKDKEGLTYQYITIPAKYEDKISTLSSENIKIIDIKRHKNKLRIGHLKGNKFFIRLKKVNEVDAIRLQNVLESMQTNGIANYFGYQRFGIEENNYIAGLEILQGKRRVRDRKKRDSEKI